MPFEKPLTSSFADLREDLKHFIQTRFELLRTEIREMIRAWRGPVILFALAGLMLVSSWFALVFTLVAVLHAWITGTNFGWFWAGLIITLFFLFGAVGIGAAGYAGVGEANLKPTRTLRVLKQDQEWIQKQARSI